MQQPVENTQPKVRGGYHWVYAVALLLALAMAGFGSYLAVERDNWFVLSAGVIAVFMVLLTWPLALAFEAGRRHQAQVVGNINRTLDDRLEQMSILLNLISEQQLLSDRAKSVAYRDKDVEALRRAIREEISKCNWEAANTLVNEIESSFGFRVEAAQYRQELESCRGKHEQKLIADTVALIDRSARAERWADAHEEARKLAAQLPDSEQVRRLPAEIDTRRQQHKERLIESWHDAVARKDVDGSIEILKQLDTYLTPDEAAGLQEAARTVFKEKLNLLRMQFAGAVQDHRWAEAVDLGEQIVRDFPNTKIAQEVAEKMPTLQQRANEPQPAKT